MVDVGSISHLMMNYGHYTCHKMGCHECVVGNDIWGDDSGGMSKGE